MRRSENLCNWHRRGLPAWAIGMRFFNRGCSKCEEKLARGEISESDPSSMKLHRPRNRYAGAYSKAFRLQSG